MARVTPEEFAEKHARRLKGSIEDIRNGINNVTVAPGKLAAAKADKMKANLIAAIESGKWSGRVGAVSLEEWKSKMLDKGLTRIPSGIDAAHDKVVGFANQFLPAVDAARSKVQSMPDMTLEDNIARSAAFIREMSKFRKK